MRFASGAFNASAESLWPSPIFVEIHRESDKYGKIFYVLLQAAPINPSKISRFCTLA